MSKLRKMLLTAAALAALAVGGAAFAQAQNAASLPATVQQAGSGAAAEQGSAAEDPGSAADNEARDTPDASDTPGAQGHNDAGPAGEVEDGN